MCEPYPFRHDRIAAHFSCQLILFHAPEVQQIVKMKPGKLCFPQSFVAKLAAALHDCPKHLIVASSSKENLPRVELEKCTSN